MTPESVQILASAIGGALGAGGAVAGLYKLIWAIFRAMRLRSATEAERKSLNEINPNFLLPFVLVGAGALSLLLGGHRDQLAAAARPPKPPIPCKCPPDCVGPTCGCDKNCDCRCGARPPQPVQRPRVSAVDALAVLPVYAGGGRLFELF